MALLLGQLTPIDKLNQFEGQKVKDSAYPANNGQVDENQGEHGQNSLYMNIYEIFPGPHLDKTTKYEYTIPSAKGLYESTVIWASV